MSDSNLQITEKSEAQVRIEQALKVARMATRSIMAIDPNFPSDRLTFAWGALNEVISILEDR